MEADIRNFQAEGDYVATLKQGEALAAQIAAVAKGLAAASATPNDGPSEQLLVKASDIIIELRRQVLLVRMLCITALQADRSPSLQDMLQSVAKGTNNTTYFLNEPMGSGAQVRSFLRQQ